MGYEDGEWNIDIATTESTRQNASNVLERALGQKKDYVVIFPFASNEQKEWREGHWENWTTRSRRHNQTRHTCCRRRQRPHSYIAVAQRARYRAIWTHSTLRLCGQQA